MNYTVSKYNWQIYLLGVDGTRTKVLYKDKGQKELLIDAYLAESFEF